MNFYEMSLGTFVWEAWRFYELSLNMNFYEMSLGTFVWGALSFHELSLNMNFYEMSLGTFIQESLGKLWNNSGRNFNKVYIKMIRSIRFLFITCKPSAWHAFQGFLALNIFGYIT